METLLKIDLYSEFEQVAEEILNNLYYSRNPVTFIEQIDIDKAKSYLRNIIFNCNFDISKVKEVIEEKNWDQEKTKCLTSLIEKKHQELLYAAFNYYNSSYGDIVIDTKWSVQLVFGTSELKTLRYPLLQLTLDTVNNKGEQKRDMLELKKDMLLKLINTLEATCKA